MPRTIESELHEALLDLVAEGTHDYEEQSLIVAEASDIYRRTAAAPGQRRPGTQHKARLAANLHEARMMDALLQSLGHLSDWSREDATVTASTEGKLYVQGTNLSASQIVSRIASAPTRGFGAGFGAGMDILNDDDVDVFLGNPKGHKANDYDIDDDVEIHHPELYRTPGIGRHRSDSHGFGNT